MLGSVPSTTTLTILDSRSTMMLASLLLYPLKKDPYFKDTRTKDLTNTRIKLFLFLSNRPKKTLWDFTRKDMVGGKTGE